MDRSLGNLPHAPTSFVGRGRELAEVRGILADWCWIIVSMGVSNCQRLDGIPLAIELATAETQALAERIRSAND